MTIAPDHFTDQLVTLPYWLAADAASTAIVAVINAPVMAAAFPDARTATGVAGIIPTIPGPTSNDHPVLLFARGDIANAAVARVIDDALATVLVGPVVARGENPKILNHMVSDFDAARDPTVGKLVASKLPAKKVRPPT